jgi:hypothetical protein
VKELKRKGTAMVGVFHDRSSMNAVADRVLDSAMERAEHERTGRFIIENARIVTPEGTLDGASASIRQGRLDKIATDSSATEAHASTRTAAGCCRV